MANRNFTNQQYSLVKGRVSLWARVSIGATGAPTLSKWNPATRTYTSAPTTGTGPYAIGCEGIKSIARNDVGVYTITLQNTYQRLLALKATFSNSTGLPTILSVGIWSAATDVTVASAPVVKFSTLSSTGTAADPASGDIMQLEFELQNSAVI